MGKKTADSDRYQWQLSYLAEFTNNFKYIKGQLTALVDTFSRLPAEEKTSPTQWNEKKLLAAQLEDHQTLAADGRLVAGPGFLLGREKERWSVKTDPCSQAAIKALHEDTHASQQQIINIAKGRYLRPGFRDKKV